MLQTRPFTLRVIEWRPSVRSKRLLQYSPVKMIVVKGFVSAVLVHATLDQFHLNVNFGRWVKWKEGKKNLVEVF